MIDFSWVALLIKEIGQPLGEKLWQTLNGKVHLDDLKKASELVQNGASAMEALQKVLGNRFQTILGEALGEGESQFAYEAGWQDYGHRDQSAGDTPEQKIESLRASFNRNLERITSLYGKKHKSVLNHFRGCFIRWKQEYKAVFFPLTGDEEKFFHTIEKLLDGKKKTIRQVFRILRQTSMGTIGAAFVIKGILLAFGVGAGLLTKLQIWMFGIPGMQVAGFLTAGTGIGAVSFVRLRNQDIMSACTSIVYKMLDNRQKNL